MGSNKSLDFTNIFIKSPGMQVLQKQLNVQEAAVAMFSNFDHNSAVSQIGQQLSHITDSTQNTTLSEAYLIAERINSMTAPIVEIANTYTQIFSSVQELADSLNGLVHYYHGETMRAMTQRLSEFVLNANQPLLSSVQYLADTMKEHSVFTIASAFANSFQFVDSVKSDILDYKKVNPYEELSPKELDEELKRQIEIDNEILVKNIPYNVFSRRFITKYYLPVSGMAYSLENTGTFDLEFVTQFILFSLIPFISEISKKKNEDE